MNRKIILLLICSMVLGITACGRTENTMSENYIKQSEETDDNDTIDDVSKTENAGDIEGIDGKVLVAYFTYAENIGDTSSMSVDAISSASLGTTANTEGNLQVMAEIIQQSKDADVFHIIVKEPYDAEYATMRNRALNEISNNILPELTENVDNIEQYDTVYLGTPVWSGSLPQPVVSFLTENNLSGKIIIPFGIHLGSRFGKTLAQIEELCPESTLKEGFTIEASTDNDDVRDEFSRWLENE